MVSSPVGVDRVKLVDETYKYLSSPQPPAEEVSVHSPLATCIPHAPHMECRVLGLFFTYHKEGILPSDYNPIPVEDDMGKEEPVTLQSVKDTPTLETPPITVKDVEL